MNAQSGEYVTYEQSAIKINTPQGISKRKVMLFWKRISDVEIHEGDFDVMLNHELKDLGIAIIYSVANESLSLSGFSANLLHLTGYTEKEIKEEFGGNLWKLIHEEDKKTALEEYLQQRRSGNTINLTYRIRRKNGQAIWVYQIGRLYTENSQEHFCSVLINISEQKKEADNLRRMRDAYRRLVERGSDMTFKWDMRTDTLYFPEEFKDFFGYEPISSFASSKLFNSSHVHPSDIKNVERIYKAFLVGSDYQETEIRIAGSSGKYKWFGVKASMEKDEADEPLAVIGILNDIDNEKNMLASLQEQANLDSLTNIANKRHASKKIEKALTEVGEEAKAAMWIMDIDYFKDINDKYGHHVGDLVLVKMAQTLESMFRKDDIVARIGGDEFLIYMKNIKSEEDIKKKSKILINKVRNLFSDEEKDIKITCSVGISIAPKDGNDYNVLYQKADRALYHAKNAGRNRAVIYIEGWNQSRGLSEDMERRTALDSDSVLPLTVRYESMLRFVQRTLVESKNIKKSINDVLRLVGDEFGVSRAYIFENTKDNTCCNNTFEWCSEGIVSQIDVLQNLNYEKDLGGDYLDNFNEWGTFYCHDIDLLPQKQYQILEPQGIKSMLQVLLKDKGEAIGFLGFDQCNVKRMWREDEISTLQFIASTLAPYIANYTTK